MLLVAAISTAFGCGVIRAGQASTRNFTVTGFTTLPAPLVYAGMPAVSPQIPGIAANKQGAQAFVSRLVMQTVS
ncbi:hypothetical protein KIN20_011181 [Parelaphostrongylus tenuis]|uniref:Uncharacterized protein n=1 Tax=Parelaphostrongylus tenuis TaxID=148309 RepID=A0AAD5QJG1_PARTN|nr:hypothetical protein KIN20_011181 [Parelaphostrongylus tenuis]